MFELTLLPTTSYELVLHSTVGGIEGEVELVLGTQQNDVGVELVLSPFFVGPKGDKGDTGDAGGSLMLPAGEAINATIPVVTDTLGRAIKASNLNPAHIGRVFGMTTSAALVGEAVNIVPIGMLENLTWTFSEGPIFLGDGQLTQTAPTSGFLQIIGTALSATKISVNIQQPFKR